MDLSINQFLVTLLVIVVLALACVIVGGWLVFRSKAAPGERLIGPAPKGTVFTIPDVASAPDIVDEAPDKRMLERTEQFMEKLLGGK
jgi:hypothetical protein